MAVTLPVPLTESIQNRKCVLFVGSGLSAGVGYPTWEKLIQILVDEAKRIPHARIRGIEEVERERDYFTLAEFARSALGPSQYAAILKRELGCPKKPSPSHHAIAGTNYRGIITTNYDKILETAFTLVRLWAPNKFTPESVSALANALYDSNMFILKVHGDIDSPQSIVLTNRDYDRLILRNPHVRSFLQATFLNYTLFFVGYGIRDPDFKLLLGELTLIFENFIPTNYALLPDAPEFIIEDMLKRMNIQIISYDPHDGHREVEDVLLMVERCFPWTQPPPP